MQDEDLIAAECELHRLLEELDALYPMWRHAQDVEARARIGDQIGSIHRRLAELHGTFAMSQRKP